MRLSEAIRLGVMLRTQGFGSYFPDKDSACAVGAALLAVGTKFISEAGPWPWLFKNHPLACPDCGTLGKKWLRFFCPLHTVSHLNDKHCWTRERIADWVATVEPVEGQDVRDPRYVDSAPYDMETAKRANDDGTL